jgi:hypothetical protein
VASPRSMVRGVCSSAASRVDRRLTATQPHSTQRRGAQILAHIRSGEASLQIWPLPPANISSIASGNVTGAVTTSTFPTGNHVLHFFGMFDMDASRPWQEYHKRSDGFYDESDRDWFRLCCTILVFRLLGLLAIFLKAKSKKTAGKTATADAAAEAEAMAASAQEGGKSAVSGGSWRERAEIHLKWQQLGMTGSDGRVILQNLSPCQQLRRAGVVGWARNAT